MWMPQVPDAIKCPPRLRIADPIHWKGVTRRAIAIASANRPTMSLPVAPVWMLDRLDVPPPWSLPWQQPRNRWP